MGVVRNWVAMWDPQFCGGIATLWSLAGSYSRVVYVILGPGGRAASCNVNWRCFWRSNSRYGNKRRTANMHSSDFHFCFLVLES